MLEHQPRLLTAFHSVSRTAVFYLCFFKGPFLFFYVCLCVCGVCVCVCVCLFAFARVPVKAVFNKKKKKVTMVCKMQIGIDSNDFKIL